MKLNSINNQKYNQNFKANVFEKTAQFVAEKPVIAAGLAASSVVAQKIVMSGSEAIIGPAMDIGIGKVITKVTDEKDGRTNESSKVQAIRTFSQSVGGTIVGVAIRLICIGAITAAFMKIGKDAGSKIGQIINPDKLANDFQYKENIEKWGKTIGGATATLVMLVTNFIIDAPFINWINTKTTELVNKNSKKPQTTETQAKEVK